MPSWVYKITDKDDKCIYVGSTTGKYFCLRVGDHRKPFNTTKQPKLKNYIADNGGWGEFQFNIISTFETIEKEELLIIEKQHIQSLTPLCNSINPITTPEERRVRHLETSKIWRQNNPDKVSNQKERAKAKEGYYIPIAKRCSTHIQCECGGTYTLQNKTNHFSRNIHKQYEDRSKSNQD